jgi:hypothetical protein
MEKIGFIFIYYETHRSMLLLEKLSYFGIRERYLTYSYNGKE